MQILKETSALGRLIIKPVDRVLAKDLIIANHYSHKWNEGGFGKYNFGIFRADEPDVCLGVAVYGYMKKPTSKVVHAPKSQRLDVRAQPNVDRRHARTQRRERSNSRLD